MEIKDIKAGLTLSAVIQHYGLKADKYNRINCPFHNDKTPSMQLYYKTNTAYCFSSNCSTHGKSIDVIDFIMNMEKSNKHQAIEKAKELAGETPNVPITNKQVEMKAPELNQQARIALLSKFWQQSQTSFKRNPKAENYCKNRSLAIEILQAGFSTDEYHRHWNEQMKETAVKIGLLKKLPDSRYSTHFKNCILFAHKNKAGQVIDIYGRAITEEKESRHYYLPGRHQGLYPGYPKTDTKRLILTESHIDAATLLQILDLRDKTLEKTFVLACYGTNGFTSEHTEAVSQLKELEEIIIFFDGDEAGGKGAEKIKSEILNTKSEIKIRIVETPEGEDVNSLLQGHESEILKHLIEGKSFSSNENENKTETSEEIPQLNLFVPAKSKLNTSNPDQITWQSDNLLFTILGGISLQHLDRLRVTIKINIVPQLSPLHSIRHNIDLYQDDALQKFTRRAAEKLETGTREIARSLAELTEELERYRAEKLESLKQQSVKKKQLSVKETEEAISYLSQENLMERTIADLAKSGIIGESYNSMILYLAMSSRKSEDPVSVICLSGSGTGKSYLQEKVAECIPEEDRIENTQFTENSFYYFKREEIKNKIFLIEDLDGAEAVLYPIRELQSKKRISKTVTLKDSKGNLRTLTLVVEGPVTVIAATTREKIYEDNANRSLLIYLDTGREQDKKVMDYQKQLRAGLIDKEEEIQVREKLQNAQRFIRPLKVINPYAPLIELPQEVFKPRRTIGLLLSFIDAVTLYHQHQREEKEGSIETSSEDVEWAFKLLKETLFRKSDELSGAVRNFFESLKNHLKQEKKKNFYASEIRRPLGQNPRSVQRYLYELLQYGYIKISGGNRHRKGYEYEIAEANDYRQLQSSIDKKLTEIMEKIREAEKNGKKKTARQSDKSATKGLLSH